MRLLNNKIKDIKVLKLLSRIN